MESVGIYVHIPFCKQKCYYCDFVSFADANCVEEYVQAVLEEIEYIANKESILKKIDTIYIGGRNAFVY